MNLAKPHFHTTDWVSHWGTLEFWWKLRRYPSPQKMFLPPTGIVIWHEELPLCAGFLFKTDANIAVINHLISNPGISGTVKYYRSLAIDELLNWMINRAKNDGFKMITGASNVERLNERYVKLGFAKSDENETHFGRML